MGPSLPFPFVERLQGPLQDFFLPFRSGNFSIGSNFHGPVYHPGLQSVFFIDPAKNIRAMFTYAASTGRIFQEILRVLEAGQIGVFPSPRVANPRKFA